MNDAIGILSVGGRTMPVLPKIPESHALELLGLAGAIPRMDTLAAQAATGTSLFDLLSRWLVHSVERVLRRDLMKDYQAHREEMAHVRGRISIKETTLAVTLGRARVTCEFDELDRDNPLNRVLLAALRLVCGAPFAAPEVRTQARRVSARFDEVSELRHGDLRVTLTPRTAYYSDGLAIAKALLRGAARKLDAGGEVAWAFLIRTPEGIEAGIRTVLHNALDPAFKVEKRGLALLPSTKTLNPDLVFGHLAVGDVKYKLQGADWDTGDLYQAVAFATGFQVSEAAILTFSTGQAGHTSLQVGDVRLSNFCWPADPSLGPQEAAARLVTDVREWLYEVSAS
ncbi:McrC family protein [Nocardioides mesophilus]|uniref:Restriction endonuclease n=1 Tax=Nocardioides mesophilus TaxID=433659 RepID=A0A7G9RD91_9ACTN|nr:hypothetical protein [Nocardioides mesophilus]QNN53566.1 hypothetical protein H9L09_03825 [Nocardioides mesophilus]